MRPKRYLALARVSSDEQEREGFSLDAQEEALREWAAKNNAQIAHLYRVAETAHKSDQRTTFHAMLAHAREHAAELEGLLFYKVDRAARNMKDWTALLELRDRHSLRVVCVTEPFDESPAGQLNGNMMAAISQFYSDQLSVRVRDGMGQRVRSGLFSGRAPYGYENYRENGRGLVRIHEERAANVRRAFDLYAYHHHTLDSLSAKLRDEGRVFSPSSPHFSRSKLHQMLMDRSYLGEVRHRGQWHPGTHKPIIDHATFSRVGTMLGVIACSSHESVYGSALVECGHCGRPVICEIKIKKTRAGDREYRYYRCSRYNAEGHPRDRVGESAFDTVILDLFRRMRVDDPAIHRWVENVIRAKARDDMKENTRRAQEVAGQIAKLRKDRDVLLTLRMHDEISAGTYADKDAELRDRMGLLSVVTDGRDREKSEIAELALKVFELSQALLDKWVAADIHEKRALLEILCLNLTYRGKTLCATMRKPFDILAEGPLQKNGGRCPDRTGHLLLVRQAL